MKVNKTKYPQYETYIELCKTKTESEIANIMQVNRRTVRRYKEKTGIKPKPSKLTNKTPEEWIQHFNNTYDTLIAKRVYSEKNRVKGEIVCTKCGTQWSTRISDKMSNKTKCITCDKGNHGDLYSFENVQKRLDTIETGRWKLIKYGNYSKRNSIIQCTKCNRQTQVMLSEWFIRPHSCRNCEIGSYGEYMVATILKTNNIPYKREFVVEFTDRIGRIDFVTDTLAIEYNGEQHYDTSSIFYSERINETYNMKRQWALQNGYQFIELNGKDATEIYKQIVDQSGLKLTEPTADDFAQHNNNIVEVLHYLETHTKAETAKHFNISENRIYKFVQLIGYENVREWRKTHKFTQK